MAGLPNLITVIRFNISKLVLIQHTQILDWRNKMFLVIQNSALKSFAGRLKALKANYPLKVNTMAALDGCELYYLDVDIHEDDLSSFAEDARFGFGEDFKVERLSNEPSYDYQTEHYIEVEAGEGAEEQLLEVRKLFADKSISYRALEFINDAVSSTKIRAYANSISERDVIAETIA